MYAMELGHLATLFEEAADADPVVVDNRRKHL